MEMRQIQLFVLLAEYRNFSKVAELYNISQSAISKQLSLLEYELGGKLFIRDTRRVDISDLGYVFLPYAKQIVALEKDALEAAHESAQNSMFESMNLYIDNSLLHEVVSLHYPEMILRAAYQFNQKYPNHMIRTQTFPSNEWRAQLRFKLFDLALMRIPASQLSEPIMSSMETAPIHTIHQFLVVHDSRLQQASFSDAIASIGILLQDQSLTIKDTMGRFLTKLQPIARLVDCNNWNDLFLRLMSSHAATVVPENMLSYFHDMDVHIYPLQNLDLEECICALWQKNARNEAIPDLIRSMEDVFRGAPSR
mgnify:CR=1 FL=1